jgi:hypothetical protein
MIQIKKTKSLAMIYDQDKKYLWIHLDKGAGIYEKISIPTKYVFQLERGLKSWVQRFYRKHEKVANK